MHLFAHFDIKFNYKNSQFGNQIALFFLLIYSHLANDSKNNKIDRDQAFIFSMNPERLRIRFRNDHWSRWSICISTRHRMRCEIKHNY